MTADLVFKREDKDKEREFSIKCDSHSTMAIVLGILMKTKMVKPKQVRLNESEATEPIKDE
jgi:hypothetical protein